MPLTFKKNKMCLIRKRARWCAKRKLEEVARFSRAVCRIPYRATHSHTHAHLTACWWCHCVDFRSACAPRFMIILNNITSATRRRQPTPLNRVPSLNNILYRYIYIYFVFERMFIRSRRTYIYVHIHKRRYIMFFFIYAHNKTTYKLHHHISAGLSRLECYGDGAVASSPSSRCWRQSSEHEQVLMMFNTHTHTWIAFCVYIHNTYRYRVVGRVNLKKSTSKKTDI